MTLAIKVELKEANKAKEYLMKKGVLSKDFKALKEGEFLYFPVAEKIKSKYNIVDKCLEQTDNKPTSLKEVLGSILTKKEFEKVKTAYDVIGDIAILEIDVDLRKKEKDIGEALLKLRKDIKTVVRKEGGHEGEFRVQKMTWLAGENKNEALHKENNVLLKMDIEQVYFSPRLSTERKRIAEQVNASRKKEDILVMFSGCAPYCCVIAKNAAQKVNSIIGIEINPLGHKYGIENLRINNIKKVRLINDDVKKAVPLLFKEGLTFDRILMPLPKHAEDFLEDALAVSKKGTIIHLYNFLHEKEFDMAEKMIKEACVKAGKKYKMLEFVKCGQQSPDVYRICADFKVM